MPIATRIDMLATGIKTPLGVKVAGPDLRVIDTIGAQIEGLLRPLPGTASVYAERAGRARYIDIDVDRDSAAHYGLSVADIYEIIALAVGGMNITYTVEGRERYPINLRYPREVRNSLDCAAGSAGVPRYRAAGTSGRCRGRRDQGRSRHDQERGRAAERLGVRRHRRGAIWAPTSPTPSASWPTT